MDVLLLAVAIITISFGFVVFYGAPYLPTLNKQATTALDLLDLKPGQLLLDLGAGDGTVAIAALRRGLRVTAIEINPLLCMVIYCRTFRFRSNITIKCANFWTTSWGVYDGVYVFLLDRFMTKLDKRIMTENKNLRLASYAFKIPSREVVYEKDGIYLYEYHDN